MDLTFLHGLTRSQLLLAAVAVAAAVFLLRWLFARKPESPHTELRRCSCGWVGEVSRYRPVCPKCAKRLAG